MAQTGTHILCGVRVKTGGGRMVATELPREEVIELTIDIDALVVALGLRAIVNAGGKAAIMGGKIRARHVRTKRGAN